MAHAGSARKALRMLVHGPVIALPVTDQLMPGITAADLARGVRKRCRVTPVLVISGLAETEAIAPEFPWLIKPFRRADLAASLAALP